MTKILTKSRNLVGWGIRHITFVDYGRVSHSNPVRQSLFTYEDALNGGRPKAIAAAENLSKIQPSIVSEGHHINIPMPGHYTDPSKLATALEEVKKIDQLVQEHDAVFLLLDTREARWLGTLLSAAHNKVKQNQNNLNPEEKL